MSKTNCFSLDLFARRISSGSSDGSISTIILSSAILCPIKDEPKIISSSVSGRIRQATFKFIFLFLKDALDSKRKKYDLLLFQSLNLMTNDN